MVYTTCIVLIPVAILIFFMENPQEERNKARIYGFILGTSILSISSGLVVLHMEYIPDNTCFTTTEHWDGVDLDEVIDDKKQELKEHQKNIAIATRVKAENLANLIEYEARLKANLKEAVYEKMRVSKTYPIKEEFMVLSKMDYGYTVLNERNVLVTNWKLNRSTALHQEKSPNITFHSCSPKMVSMANVIRNNLASR